MTLELRLALTFTALLHARLGPRQMATVVRRNFRAGDDTCASHDFCDANVYMDEAFELVTGAAATDSGGERPDTARQDGCMSDAAADLWNAAWTTAKAAGFDLDRLRHS